MNQPMAPFSFFSTIFVHDMDYEKEQIPQAVLLHELAHTRQKHSFDMIFIELLQILFWFNPLILLYKRAMRLNHEYLADAAVLQAKTDLFAYQNQLLNNVFRN